MVRLVPLTGFLELDAIIAGGGAGFIACRKIVFGLEDRAIPAKRDTTDAAAARKHIPGR